MHISINLFKLVHVVLVVYKCGGRKHSWFECAANATVAQISRAEGMLMLLTYTRQVGKLKKRFGP